MTTDREFDVWGEDKKYDRQDWRNEVLNGDTNLGYWEWVEACRERDDDGIDHKDED